MQLRGKQVISGGFIAHQKCEKKPKSVLKNGSGKGGAAGLK